MNSIFYEFERFLKHLPPKIPSPAPTRPIPISLGELSPHTKAPQPSTYASANPVPRPGLSQPAPQTMTQSAQPSPTTPPARPHPKLSAQPSPNIKPQPTQSPH